MDALNYLQLALLHDESEVGLLCIVVAGCTAVVCTPADTDAAGIVCALSCSVVEPQLKVVGCN